MLCAKPAIGREPFVVLLADDVMRGDLPTQRLVSTYAENHGTILSVMEVPVPEAQKYGIVRPGSDGSVAELVEKPAPGTEPLHLASIGRYVLEPEIFYILQAQPPGHSGEIQLADAINTRAARGHVRSLTLKGQPYDCGSKMGYLEAVMDFALVHPEYSERFGVLVDNKAAARQARAAECRQGFFSNEDCSYWVRLCGPVECSNSGSIEHCRRGGRVRRAGRAS